MVSIWVRYECICQVSHMNHEIHPFFLASMRKFINPIQDGGTKRPLPISFSPVTSTNVEFGPQNFLTFSFNSFAILVQNFKFLPSTSPKLLNLNQDHPSKKSDFSGQILINWRYDNVSHRNATLPNFGNMTTSIT